MKVRTRRRWTGFIVVGLVIALFPLTRGEEKGTDPPARLGVAPTSERLVEVDRIEVPGAANLDGALTADETLMCVVKNRISNEDPRGGLYLVDLATQSVLVQHTLEGKGFTSEVAATTHEGISRCYMTISRQSGGTDTEGLDRLEVFRIDEDILVREASIVMPPFCTSNFGPIGISASTDGKRLYVGDRGCVRVHVIDADPASDRFHEVLSSVQTGGVVIGVDLTPDGSRVYAVNRGPDEASLACIDTTEAEGDPPDNAWGGTACNGVAEIPLGIGVSGGLAAVAISPDGNRAYAVANTADQCIAVVDTNPDSKTFNRTIDVMATTGDLLQALEVSRDGKQLFVAAGTPHELIVFNTATLVQTQRLTVAPRPNNILVPRAGPVEAYVVSTGRRIPILERGLGPMLSGSEDGSGADLLSDLSDPTDCPVPATPDEPDSGIDPPIRIERDGNRLLFFRESEFDPFREILLLNPHPLNGSPQDFLIRNLELPAEASPPGSILGALQSLVVQGLDLMDFRSSRTSIDGYDSTLRPNSASISSEFLGTETVMTSMLANDEDGNGIKEGVTIELPLLPDIEVPVDLFGSGDSSEYMGLTLPAPLSFSLLKFLPLGDTNNAGLPDSAGFDIDGDGEADPDLPLFPFVAGAENPEVELKIHFAQFGDGTAGEAKLSSRITLFNLDPDAPAQVKILLRKDDGSALTVDLNGEEVAGQKELVIQAGGMVQLSTDGEGPLVAGSVIVCSDRAVAGVILFSGNVGVAGVGVSHVMAHGFVAPIETSVQAGVNTGIAVMNLRDTEFTVPLVLCDVDGKRLAAGAVVLAGFGHRSLFVDEIDWVLEEGVELDLASFTGTLKAEEGKLAATVIQVQPGEFATQPVAPNFGQLRFGLLTIADQATAPAGKAEPELNQKLYFAQFGNGGAPGAEVFSQILLLNLTDREANVKVLLKNDDGEPLSVTLNDEVVEGEKELVIPAGGLSVLRSDGKGDLISGSVLVCSDQGLAGNVLFGGSVGAAGVGSSALVLQGFTAPVQSNSEERLSTGIAITNGETDELVVQLALAGVDAMSVATAELTLAGMGHRALFLEQIEWKVEEGMELDPSNFVGLLTARAPGRLAGTVISTSPGFFSTLPAMPNLK